MTGSVSVYGGGGSCVAALDVPSRRSLSDLSRWARASSLDNGSSNAPPIGKLFNAIVTHQHEPSC